MKSKMEDGGTRQALLAGQGPGQVQVGGVAVHAANPFAQAVNGTDGQIVLQQPNMGAKPGIHPLKKQYVLYK